MKCPSAAMQLQQGLHPVAPNPLWLEIKGVSVHKPWFSKSLEWIWPPMGPPEEVNMQSHANVRRKRACLLQTLNLVIECYWYVIDKHFHTLSNKMLQHKNMQAHFSSCTTTKKENITPIKTVHQSLAAFHSVQITQAPKETRIVSAAS